MNDRKADTEIPDDSSESAASVSAQPASDGQSGVQRVLNLAQRISDLVHGRARPVDDPELSFSVAQAVKPYVDRIFSLKRLLEPVDRIIDKRQQIQLLQAGLAEDVAEVENASTSGPALEPDLLSELQGEIAAVKRDRKIYISDEDIEEEDSLASEPSTQDPPPEDASDSAPSGKRQRLLDLPVAERLAVIFGSRFIGVPRLSELFNAEFAGDVAAEANAKLETVWKELFESDAIMPHVRANRVKALRKAFADYALIYRCTEVPLRADGDLVPCHVEALKNSFEPRFAAHANRSLWYSKLPFYRESIANGHWALVDHQYLNCTFKKPRIRLLMYARANGIPDTAIRQKSVTEDVYDRLVLAEALGSRFFENCNALTRTAYQMQGEKSKKQVYVYFDGDEIRISGKRGVPHWRPGRPRWPGVLPAAVF